MALGASQVCALRGDFTNFTNIVCEAPELKAAVTFAHSPFDGTKLLRGELN